MSAQPRYRVVCADGTVVARANDRATAEYLAEHGAWDDLDLNCGPHRVEEVPDDE